jgi:hypothetical protein
MVFSDGLAATMNDQAQFPAMLDDYGWLVGPEAGDWLKTAQSAMQEERASLLHLTTRLRQKLPQPRVHLLLEQLELRGKAREKFSQPERMFFSPLALEQATDQWVASYKASRFSPDQLAADLCCGIGGDLLALAQRGPVWAVDRNPIAVILSQANQKAILRSDAAEDSEGLISNVAERGVKFDVMDVADAASSMDGVAAWHIDPDRRPTGKRTTKVELHDPGPAVLARLLSICPHAAIKLAPAADLIEPWWTDAELEWISRSRQCRQLVAWFGNLAQHPGRRRATVIRPATSKDENQPSGDRPTVAATLIGQPNLECPLAPKIGRYVLEPDAAVLAAKLEGDLAIRHNLMAMTPGVAYFTADQPVESKLLDCFEVLEVMPCRIKPLRQWLASRGIGRLEVKKRGVPLDPEEVRRELLVSNQGSEEATLLLTRIGSQIMAIVAKRVRC